MNEGPMPGSSSADQELERRWRQHSAEQPSSSSDARIRAAARDAIATPAPQAVRPVRRSVRWTRFVPLAAAASVALLAVGLVRLMPRQEYQAIPAPRVDRPGEARDAPSVTPAESEPYTESWPGDAFHSSEGSPASPPEPEQAPDDAESRAHAPEPMRESGHAQHAEGVTTEEPRTASPTAAAVDDQASAERAEKASEARPASAASGPAEIGTTAAPAAARRAYPATISALPAGLAARVRNDAARRTGLDLESIRIVAVDPVASLDGSPGCDVSGPPTPETPGQGYIVTVEASDRTLRYNTDGRDRIAICATE